MRGIAVLLMLISNFLFDLHFFAEVISSNSLFLNWLARGTAGLFILLVGVSLQLKHATVKEKACKQNLLRGVKLFGLGMVVTVVTRMATGEGYVVFGILHLIGLGIVLAYPLLHYRWLSLVLGVCVVVGAPFVVQQKISSPWLIWLGVQSDGFYSVDYTPIFPWFGLLLVGIFLGASLYPQRKQRWSEPMFVAVFPFLGLSFIGRHSLLIYFVHQPIFLSAFALARWLT